MIKRSTRLSVTALAAAAIALSLGLAGCGPSGSDVASTPTATRTPAKTPTATPAPTPSPTPTARTQVVPPATPPVQPVTPPQSNPNAVNNADYVSHATDSDGGAITGVEFMTAAGDIVCGITGPGGSVSAGSAVCTPSTWAEIIPQATPDTGPFVHAAVVNRGGIASYLYPDWFSQPARTIPVLPAGKVISLEGMTCEAIGATVRCSDDSTGTGFLASTEAITFF